MSGAAGPSQPAPSTAARGSRGSQWLLMEEVVLLLANSAANDERQQSHEDERERRTREFYSAYLKKVDEVGLWVPGMRNSAQPQTAEESIEMRTREGAASLVNRAKVIRSCVNKALMKMAQVMSSTGYEPPSGNDWWQYWTKSAEDAAALLGTQAPYLEHLSYLSPTSWRLFDSFKAPAPPAREECGFTDAQRALFEKWVRPQYRINPKIAKLGLSQAMAIFVLISREHKKNLCAVFEPCSSSQ